jgi:hypothetical protein
MSHLRRALLRTFGKRHQRTAAGRQPRPTACAACCAPAPAPAPRSSPTARGRAPPGTSTPTTDTSPCGRPGRAPRQLRATYHHPRTEPGRTLPEQILEFSPSCPAPAIVRPGRTLEQWKTASLAWFDTGRSINGGHRSPQRPHRTPLPGRPRSGNRRTTGYGCSSSPAESPTLPRVSKQSPIT